MDRSWPRCTQPANRNLPHSDVLFSIASTLSCKSELENISQYEQVWTVYRLHSCYRAQVSQNDGSMPLPVVVIVESRVSQNWRRLTTSYRNECGKWIVDRPEIHETSLNFLDLFCIVRMKPSDQSHGVSVQTISYCALDSFLSII